MKSPRHRQWASVRAKSVANPATTGGESSRHLAFEALEDRRLLAGTTLGVHAAGRTGSENLQLLIDGAVVANWTTTRVLAADRTFDVFTYTYPTDVSIDRIRVAFTNDGVTPTGGNRDLIVDGVTLRGVKYESEASSVYSTGVWDPATNARVPGYRQSETLAYNGYFQFGARGSTIQILAAGATGTEQMQLVLAGGVAATFSNIGGNYANRQFVGFTYNSPTAIPLSQIRVQYVNDGPGPNGVDRNLKIDGVILDGIKYESESTSVFTNAGWTNGSGRTFGRLQIESLVVNGYFQYGAFGTVIEVRAAGRTGEERMELQIGGSTVATFSNVGGSYGAGQFQSFVYASSTVVPLNQVRVAYVNDGNTAEGVDRNLQVDSVVLDGVAYQAEAADVLSTGTFVSGVGKLPGLWQSEYLHGNGYFQFASGINPGTVALGTSLVTVDEFAGTVSIPVTRSGANGGTIAVRYTTVNASATAGSDYMATSGFLVFAPGETTKSIVVPITNDSLREANEAFNVAADEVLGGASITAPRTATITIVDDELPPTPGTGNGLLGQYYDNQDLTNFVFERTDPTVNFDWGTGSPSSFIASDSFSVRWVGKIEPLYSETTTFTVGSDDGVRLWVNNQLIIDKWTTQNTSVSGQIALQRGRKYDLRLEYFEGSGSAREILLWSSASQPLAVVPQSQLSSDPPAPTELGSFSGHVIATGLVQPTAIAIDSTQRMFISEQRGVVRVYQNGQLLATPFMDLQAQVNNVQDRGMIGIALHPNFPATPYVYVSYTYDPPETASRSGLAGRDGSGNRVARVSRFTADAAAGYNRVLAGSEVVLVGTNSTWANISHPELDSTDDSTLAPSGGQNGELRDILIADSRSHTVGNLAFGPDGMLYVANGDGTSFGRVDPRTSRVQSIDSLSGKILRIDPITGAGLADNPFYNGDPAANRSRVYDFGLRNPFRFAFHPTSGQLYIGDVGWQTWEEVNTGRGKDFGWPWYEGGSGTQNLKTGGYQDLAAAQAFYNSNPTVTAPVWSRSHANGAVAIVVGDFYTGDKYPASYKNSLFISDFGDNQIRVLRLNADGSLASVSALNLNVGGVVEMTMGRDGFLYYADLINGRIGRFEFTPASGLAAASVSDGAAPAVIGDFTGDSGVDGADVLAWQRGLGATAFGVSALPGDADFNGVVSSLDLALVASRFGRGDLASSVSSPTSSVNDFAGVALIANSSNGVANDAATDLAFASFANRFVKPRVRR